MLQEALLNLMKEKPFGEIQITEIVERAELSRPAFYLHFRTKEELLHSRVVAVQEEFHAEVSQEVAAANIDLKRFSIMLFQYWERHADLLRLVIEAGEQRVLLEQLRNDIALILAEIESGKRRSKEEGQQRDYVVDYLAGGTFMLLTSWISGRMPFTVEQMGALLFELAAPCANLARSALKADAPIAEQYRS
jgi:AcrR family transcriptional regulator